MRFTVGLEYGVYIVEYELESEFRAIFTQNEQVAYIDKCLAGTNIVNCWKAA